MRSCLVVVACKHGRPADQSEQTAPGRNMMRSSNIDNACRPRPTSSLHGWLACIRRSESDRCCRLGPAGNGGAEAGTRGRGTKMEPAGNGKGGSGGGARVRCWQRRNRSRREADQPRGDGFANGTRFRRVYVKSRIAINSRDPI
jgi:hypothetical protein